MIEWLIALIAGVIGIALISAINIIFLLALMVFVVIGIAAAGVFLRGLDFRYLVVTSLICLGIVAFITINALTCVGLLIIGGAMYKLTPAKQPALFVALVGVGLLVAIWGAKFVVIPLGVLP